MHEDLRRRALESRKTVSRKQALKVTSTPSSPASSRPGSNSTSRAGSRNVSRQGSDEEDGNLSDSTAWSTNSIDNMLAADDGATWETELSTRIENILGRNRRRLEQREEDLRYYVALLRAHVAADEIASSTTQLTKMFLKALASESSEVETTLALKALDITVLTDRGEDYISIAGAALRSIALSSENPSVKAGAVASLALLTFQGGAADDDIAALQTWLLRISETDGQSINAPDDAVVVAAALEGYALLATEVEDMSEESNDAITILAEQLESSDARVLVAAGEAIALLYEKSFTAVESDDDISPDEEGDLPTRIERYLAYNQRDELLDVIDGLASISSKSLSKRDKKALHTNFADIRQSVLDPKLGPRYSGALDADSGIAYGSRMNVRVAKKGRSSGGETMQVDRWWKLIRLKALKRTLASGFLEHYEGNGFVLEVLSVSDD